MPSSTLNPPSSPRSGGSLLHALNGFLIGRDLRHAHEPGEYGAKRPSGQLRSGPPNAGRIVRIRRADLSRNRK